MDIGRGRDRDGLALFDALGGRNLPANARGRDYLIYGGGGNDIGDTSSSRQEENIEKANGRDHHGILGDKRIMSRLGSELFSFIV